MTKRRHCSQQKRKQAVTISDDRSNAGSKRKLPDYSSIADAEDAGLGCSNGEHHSASQFKNWFMNHFEASLPRDVNEGDSLAQPSTETRFLDFASLGRVLHRLGSMDIAFNPKTEVDAVKRRMYVKKKLVDNLPSSLGAKRSGNAGESPDRGADEDDEPTRASKTPAITSHQADVLSILNAYVDLCYPTGSTEPETRSSMRDVICLHVINHVLKTREAITSNSARLRQASPHGASDGEPSSAADGDQSGVETPDYRDQGYVRPKVLLLLPFRHSAFEFVMTIMRLMFGADKPMVNYMARFKREYGTAPEAHPKAVKKPPDYQETFKGNTDDNFRLGIKLSKRSINLYRDFYSSDIIIASPLGMRMAIGAEGEKDYDFDFLSSIEVCILHQADIFLMQNWSHVLHILDHLNRQPSQSHDCDFSRVRLWALENQGRQYRQTVLVSAFAAPELKAVFSQHSRSFAGCIAVPFRPEVGTCSRVYVSGLPMAFQRFNCANPVEESSDRFNYFVNKVLPEYKDSSMIGTLVFIPSYFDFVRIRNFFKREDVSFVQICEYTSNKKISRARDMFYHDRRHFLLYTERFHFYRRYRIKGIRHVIFYQLPLYASFYPELCNAIGGSCDGGGGDGDESNAASTCCVIYSKLDGQRLAGVLGYSQAAKMLADRDRFQMLVTSN